MHDKYNILEKADVMSIYFRNGSTAILNDVSTGKSIRAKIKDKNLIMDKEELNKAVPRSAICIPSVDDVARRWVKDGYFEKRAYAVILEVEE